MTLQSVGIVIKALKPNNQNSGMIKTRNHRNRKIFRRKSMLEFGVKLRRTRKLIMKPSEFIIRPRKAF